MKRNFFDVKKIAVFTVVSVLSISLIACGSNSSSTPKTSETGDTKASVVTQPPWYKEPNAERLKLAQQDVISTEIMASGPQGETSFPAAKLTITDEQLEQIKAGKFTVAIAMGFSGNAWVDQQLLALNTEFKRLGIEVVSQTSADFKDSKQIADIEAAMMKKPDILVSIPLNPQTEAAVYKKASDAGIKVVFIDNPVNGMDPGKDYVSVVSSDNFGLGMQIADLLAESVGGEGDVAALYYASDFYVTNERYEGFVARLKAKHPKINLAAVAGFQDPNATENVANGLLTRYPNLKGIYPAWDLPTLGAISSAKIAGKIPSNFTIVTEGVSNEVSLNMAQNGFIKGIGAYLPYDQGIAEAQVAALAVIGASPPSFVTVPAPPVTRDNLAESWKMIYHEDLPEDIAKELK
jgi:ribose transport system substrate-binding protein